MKGQPQPPSAAPEEGPSAPLRRHSSRRLPARGGRGSSLVSRFPPTGGVGEEKRQLQPPGSGERPGASRRRRGRGERWARQVPVAVAASGGERGRRWARLPVPSARGESGWGKRGQSVSPAGNATGFGLQPAGGTPPAARGGNGRAGPGRSPWRRAERADPRPGADPGAAIGPSYAWPSAPGRARCGPAASRPAEAARGTSQVTVTESQAQRRSRAPRVPALASSSDI